MVKTEFIDRVTKILQRFLIRKIGYLLNGTTYDLILFSPTDRNYPDAKYSIILSSSAFNLSQQKDIIKEILLYLKEFSPDSDYVLISRVNILHSEDPFVKSMKLVFAFREPLYEIISYPIAGVMIDFAYMVKSMVLDKLVEGHALTMHVKTETNYRQSVNAGIIGIDDGFNVKYWTGKGLREFEELKEKTEEYLIANQYIAFVNLDNITAIY